MKKIHVLIVDDHPLMREALRIGINNVSGMKVVGEATNGKDAIDQIISKQPDIILLDLYMPLMDGMEVMNEIKAMNSDCRIIILTSSHNDANIFKAVRNGAHGFLFKDLSRETVLECIRTVASGSKYFPPQVVEKMANTTRSESDKSNLLTDREEQVLAFVGEGLTNQEIAKKLNLSRSTIRVHIHNILRKLHFQNRWQAVEYAITKRLDDEKELHF